VDLLQRLRASYPDSPEAHDATFMLARLQQDPARALALLETYRREQPQGTFAEAALGRTMRARIALGERGAARRDAQAYLEAYPEGPYAAEARQVLAQ
jgi:TolA-binding protein